MRQKNRQKVMQTLTGDWNWAHMKLQPLQI